MPLDTIDHIAIQVEDIDRAIAWYMQHFNAQVVYQDDTWAFLQFANVKLALVNKVEHPPHFAILKKNAQDFGKLTLHRDQSQSVYQTDSENNIVEIMLDQ